MILPCNTIDMTGERFGRLTVQEYVGQDKFHNALWRCKCDCGEEKIVSRKSLRCGDTRSCGCLHEHRLKGKRFGRLLVIDRGTKKRGRSNSWHCQCDCGNTLDVVASDLVSGHTTSCGCYNKEVVKNMMTTHGHSNSRLYTVWCGMHNRCKNESQIGYEHYGGRGIRVCDEWNSYEAFEKWAIENGYDENAKHGECTIDRIDNNGNYEPSNCRWVPMSVQIKNQRPRRTKAEILKAKAEKAKGEEVNK